MRLHGAMTAPDPHLVAALRAVRDGDASAAAEHARAAAASADGTTWLSRLLADHLARPVDGDVYDVPAAFQAFIAGGGNVGLYRATSAHLARRHAELRAARVLDVGCGDGRALVPALPPTRTGSPVAEVTLVEPSQALLDDAVAALASVPVVVDARHASAEAFVDALAPIDQWDVVESTFALHALEPSARTDVLHVLRGHASHLLVVEFDVDLPPEGTDEHLAELASRYEQGVGEYDTDRDLVAHGFLLPVLLGQLDADRPRATWEQPADAWRDQLLAAGWSDVVVEPVAPYWWAPAVAIAARS
jgi:SAM-dependent methyltransferase